MDGADYFVRAVYDLRSSVERELDTRRRRDALKSWLAGCFDRVGGSGHGDGVARSKGRFVLWAV